jgi:hypothetical protein
VIQDRFHIPENDSSLILVLGEAHDRQSLADRDERAEIDEASYETGDQCRDEGLTTTATDDQIRFFGTTERWRYASSVALKDGEILGGQWQAEDRFQND